MFYIIFYLFLIALGGAALHVFLASIGNDEPTFTGPKKYGCAVYKSQGVGIRPKVPFTFEERKNGAEELRATDIWVKEGNTNNNKAYVLDLLQVMKDGKCVSSFLVCHGFCASVSFLVPVTVLSVCPVCAC